MRRPVDHPEDRARTLRDAATITGLQLVAGSALLTGAERGIEEVANDAGTTKAGHAFAMTNDGPALLQFRHDERHVARRVTGKGGQLITGELNLAGRLVDVARKDGPDPIPEAEPLGVIGHPVKHPLTVIQTNHHEPPNTIRTDLATDPLKLAFSQRNSGGTRRRIRENGTGTGRQGLDLA
jgi:hypothetical protein